jgi:hypothetical protein
MDFKVTFTVRADVDSQQADELALGIAGTTGEAVDALGLEVVRDVRVLPTTKPRSGKTQWAEQHPKDLPRSLSDERHSGWDCNKAARASS